MEVAVLNIQGKETGRKVTLSDAVFGIEPNNHVVYLDVKRYLANKRQGTHKAKERNEVAGSTRKIKKQKGTGTARAGSVKSPVFVGATLACACRRPVLLGSCSFLNPAAQQTLPHGPRPALVIEIGRASCRERV